MPEGEVGGEKGEIAPDSSVRCGERGRGLSKTRRGER